MKKAFTMLELVFVIVIIGVLAAIAIPKFSTNRDEATVATALSTLSSIRSAIAQEAQRRQMAGDYSAISNLGGAIGAAGANKPIFDFFDTNNDGSVPAANANPHRVLSYAPYACQNNTSEGCWRRIGANRYEYVFPFLVSSTHAEFIVQNNRFDCNDGGDANKKKACRLLER